jgi:hypothetical protein
MLENFRFIRETMPFATHPRGRTPGTFTDFDSFDDKSDDLYYHLQYVKFGFRPRDRYDGLRDTTFDLVVVLWTLENCQDLRALLGGVQRLLNAGGHVVVVTGIRFLVPFKMPLWAYCSRNPGDTHAFRFGANTLQGALAVSGFETRHVNRNIDRDVLCAIGGAVDGEIGWPREDYLLVHSFFGRWHAETALNFPNNP